MHELGITQAIVDECATRASGAHVITVTVEVGRLAGVVPDAMRFCYDLCAEGTALEGSTLEIVELPGRMRCRACAAELDVDDLLAVCACGSVSLQLIGGDELRILHMEVS
jgi:hydrogenase nickel incorporation protein HypA/HybF